MIVNFSIQNFGSVKNKQTLSFEADKSTHLEDYYVIQAVGGLRLLKLGLIYGANASGKTTILKALDFFGNIVINPLGKKTDEFQFEPFLFDAETPKQNTILSLEFIQNNVRYFYEVEFNKKAIANEVLYVYKPNKAKVFTRTTNFENQFTSIVFGNKIKIDKTVVKILETNTLWNNTVLGGFLKTNINCKELKDATDWFYSHLAELIESQFIFEEVMYQFIDKSTEDFVLNILKKADFNISGIDIEKDINNKEKNTYQKKITFEHTVNNTIYRLPLEHESKGTIRYSGFSMILILLIRGAVTIPIDELEASLHPDLFTHFLLAFLVNSKQSQLIATTHNREILNNKDIFRNDAIWFTDKSKDGATELYSLADFDSSVIRDTSNVYNAYKIGKLGAVPNLGDYYIDVDDEKK